MIFWVRAHSGCPASVAIVIVFIFEPKHYLLMSDCQHKQQQVFSGETILRGGLRGETLKSCSSGPGRRAGLLHLGI